MAIGFGVAVPKGEPRKRAKARKTRAARQVVQSVRQQCVERDGYCRYGKLGCLLTDSDSCLGPSEWAHLHSHRRSKTRGQAAEARHTTAGSLMLCRRHHADLDAHRLIILPMNNSHGADGILIFRVTP